MIELKMRKLSKRTDWIIIGVTLLFLFLLLYFMHNGESASGAFARISADGDTVAVIALDTAADGKLSYSEIPSAQFEIQNHQIRFIEAKCPDKLCERTGWIGRPGEAAVCLPNRIVIQIEGDRRDFDIVVG